MEGFGPEVALIVKAPNQQTDDVRVRAETTWSVYQLKAHLSEVYPSKPKTDEQKIIYSGQLLGDSTILKDVLRVYEGQEAHTVHLVCAQRRYARDEHPAAEQRQQESTQPTNANTEANEGLRRRNVGEDRPPETPRPEMRQNNQNHTAEMHNFYSRMMANYGRVPPVPANLYPAPNDPAALANHMLMMQQAYLQYMQQYANMWQAAGANNAGVQPVNVANEVPQQQEAGAGAGVGGAPPELQEEEGGEGGAPRDWLDWMYAVSRLAILFSLLYFYSSPFRLALVMLLAVIGYLYQQGVFRELGWDIRHNEQARARPAAPAREDPRPDNGQDARPDNGEQPDSGPQADGQPPVQRANQQSYLMATWMIFASFFTSLIPETPNVV